MNEHKIYCLSAEGCDSRFSKDLDDLILEWECDYQSDACEKKLYHLPVPEGGIYGGQIIMRDKINGNIYTVTVHAGTVKI